MDDAIFTWRYRNYDFDVDSYGLYKVHLEGEGCSDGSGGLFNDLKLTYVRRPFPEYKDSLPAIPAD